jgi:hypothetical protein
MTKLNITWVAVEAPYIFAANTNIYMHASFGK